MLCDYTDAVARSLSQACRLVVSERTNGLDNHLVVLRCEVVWTKVLYHIVQHKEAKLQSFLNLTLKSISKCFSSQIMNKFSNHVRIHFEKLTHQLSSC